MERHTLTEKPKKKKNGLSARDYVLTQNSSLALDYKILCTYVVYMSKHVCMHACMHGWMDACMYVCMYVYIYIYVCMDRCMHVCIYIYVYIHISICINYIHV